MLPAEDEPAQEPPEQESAAGSSPDETVNPAEPDSPALKERPVIPRARIRAAINSGLRYRRPDGPSATGASEPDLAAQELQKAARVEALIARAQVLAREQHLDAARRLLGQALQSDPRNAEAWTWLGGLLIDLNPERARACLKQGLLLDPANDRARRGLAFIDKKYNNATSDSAGPVHPDRQLVLSRPEADTALDEQKEARPDIKIGLEEIIENMRQSGLEPEPDSIPLGGARYRPAVERGELVMPRRRRRLRFRVDYYAGATNRWTRPLLLPLYALAACAFLSSLLFLVTHRPQEKAPPAVSALESPAAYATPSIVLTADETFAARLRYEIDRYNRYYATARNLRQQVQHGRIGWEEYLRHSRNLQTEVKNQKKTLDSLAQAATPRLVNYYRELQTIAGLSNQAADFNVAGIENTNPEDLEESNRQFNEATRRLAELLRRLNSASPVPPVGSPAAGAFPTVTPVDGPATSRATAAPTPATPTP